MVAGRDRVLPAQGGALVVTDHDGHSTGYRPVPAAEARGIRWPRTALIGQEATRCTSVLSGR